MKEQNYLVHYASKYYDPVKAHEYYMKNRELVGRQSTKGMTDEQKNIASYVKKSINEERDHKLEERKGQYDRDRNNSIVSKNNQVQNARNQLQSDTTSELELRDQEIRRYTTQTQNKIEVLQETLKNMSPALRKYNSAKIKDEIASIRSDNAVKKETIKQSYSENVSKLRESNASKRQSIISQYSSEVEKLKEGYKSDSTSIKTEYLNKYIDELRKIRNSSGSSSAKKEDTATKEKIKKMQEAMAEEKKTKK